MINYKLLLRMIKQYSKDMSIDSIDVDDENQVDNPMVQDLEIVGGFDRYQIDAIIHAISSDDIADDDMNEINYQFVAFYLAKHHNEYEVHDINSLLRAIRNDKICKDFEEDFTNDDLDKVMIEVNRMS